ncbi:MAG TPA: tRNA (adenosine(37)-N6)-threonylcarbamoyltransferase complex dimerization subunit type 1 TsaB [Alphaproteobacteria bacterium]|nr:tRNA (adenosine(37)-N6)-threonylcarbamoyltransferase complex dimerization subunit type 1 TsaB [Alphaproteobacteria bacterium]
MKILALDTATKSCSAAISRDGKVVAHRFRLMERGQAEGLAPMVAEVLLEAGEDIPGLDLIAVTIGPGAFTGLRIGLAAATGYALAAGLPILGATTLEVVAAGIGKEEPDGRSILVALDSKRADLYVQVFSPGLEATGEPLAVAAGGLAAMLGNGPLLVVGDAAGAAVRALRDAGLDAEPSAAAGLPDAANLCTIAGRRAAETSPKVGAPPPRPLYLRLPDAKPAANLAGLRPPAKEA